MLSVSVFKGLKLASIGREVISEEYIILTANLKVQFNPTRIISLDL